MSNYNICSVVAELSIDTLVVDRVVALSVASQSSSPAEVSLAVEGINTTCVCDGVVALLAVGGIGTALVGTTAGAALTLLGLTVAGGVRSRVRVSGGVGSRVGVSGGVRSWVGVSGGVWSWVGVSGGVGSGVGFGEVGRDGLAVSVTGVVQVDDRAAESSIVSLVRDSGAGVRDYHCVGCFCRQVIEVESRAIGLLLLDQGHGVLAVGVQALLVVVVEKVVQTSSVEVDGGGVDNHETPSVTASISGTIGERGIAVLRVGIERSGGQGSSLVVGCFGLNHGSKHVLSIDERVLVENVVLRGGTVHPNRSLSRLDQDSSSGENAGLAVSVEIVIGSPDPVVLKVGR